MTKPLVAKKGTPLFKAALSLIKSVEITTETDGEFETQILDEADAEDMETLTNAFSQAESLRVFPTGTSFEDHIIFDSGFASIRARRVVGSDSVVTDVTVCTEKIATIRAHAKELESKK
jgi:hypothetical protein